MYLSSDIKIIISGVFMLLAGVIVWKKQNLLTGLLFSLLFFTMFLLSLTVGLMLYWGKPPDGFYFVLPVASIFISLFFSERWSKDTDRQIKCLSCKKDVDCEKNSCPHCGSDLTPEKIWRKKTK